MYIRLLDKHTVVNLFRLQAFISAWSFPSFSYMLLSFCCFILLFSRLVSCYLELHYGCWYRLELHSGFFLPVGLVYETDYFSLQSFYWYLVKRSVQFQISHHWSGQQLFVMCYHFSWFVGKHNAYVRCLVVSRLLPLVAKYAIYRGS